MELEARITELEIQLSYAVDRVARLDEALRAESGKVRALEHEVELLKEALRRSREELQDHEDPVPSGG